jgi:hypothetical protein
MPLLKTAADTSFADDGHVRTRSMRSFHRNFRAQVRSKPSIKQRKLTQMLEAIEVGTQAAITGSSVHTSGFHRE